MSTNETQTPTKTNVTEEFVKLSKTNEFKWYASDILVLLNSVLSIFLWRSSPGASTFFFKGAFLFSTASFGFVLFQKYHAAIPAFTTLLTDDSFQYFIYSALWLVSPRKLFSLLPIIILALFHALTYAKSYVLPIFHDKVWSGRIDNFIVSYNEPLTTASSSIEFFLLLNLIFNAILFRTRSWVTLAVYVIFFKLRFQTSTFTRQVVKQWEVRVDQLAGNPALPPAAKNIWAQFKGVIAKIPGTVVEKKQE